MSGTTTHKEETKQKKGGGGGEGVETLFLLSSILLSHNQPSFSPRCRTLLVIRGIGEENLKGRKRY